MKRYLLLAIWLTALMPAFSVRGAEDAVAYAARQEAVEQQRRLNARVQALEEALQSYQQRINILTEEVRSLREELVKATGRNDAAATQENLKHLADAIEQVDKKRIDDNERILAELKRLIAGKLSDVRPSRPTPSVQAPSGKTYEYTIKEGDTLSGILKDLRDQGFNITQKQVEAVNPSVVWTKLRIGQKILIPAP